MSRGFNPSRAAAESVRARRHAAGLSQDALARRAGISGAGISKVEVGANGYRLDTIWRIAVALGTTVDALLGPDAYARAETRQQKSGGPQP